MTALRRNAIPKPLQKLRLQLLQHSWCLDLHAMLNRLSKQDLFGDSHSYTLLFRKFNGKKFRGLRSGDRWGHLLLTSLTDQSSVKSLREKCTQLSRFSCGCTILAGVTCMTNPGKLHLLKNRLTVQKKIPCMISDIKGPSKCIRPIKVLFHILHHTFTDQSTWCRFGSIRCGFSKD